MGLVSQLDVYPQGDSKESQNPREKPASPGSRGTDSGTLADADRLQTLAAQLAALSPADRERLAALLLLGKADNS